MARPRAKKGGFSILGRHRSDLDARYGKADALSDRVFKWLDGRDAHNSLGLECWLDEAECVDTARIVLPAPRRMNRDELMRCIARYNGGNVRAPRDLKHPLSGGAKAIAFESGDWALPQKDGAGHVYGIKIWRE